MIVDLNTVKKYLRIDLDYILEDDILNLLIENAELYIKDAVTYDETNINLVKKAQLLALVLIADWYENRNFAYESNFKNVSDKVKYTVRSLITQMQCYGVILEVV